ncbi:MAG TPA: hypothetical protein VJO12_01805 [Stellaceae bacterium]|nr:hypothetical protein [Stellaceae bacterium]
MSALALVGLGLGVAALFGGAALFLAYRLGHADDQKAKLRSDQEVKDAQLAAAARRPDTRAELADRLRDERF